MEFDRLFEKVIENETEAEQAFNEFLSKRLAGAEKIQAMTEKKGGYSTLTAIHYKAKLKPYAESEKWAEKDGKEEHYKAKAKEVYKKLSNLDDLSQKEFQSLMGELEVWGEVYIRAVKPNSIKL